MAASQRLGLLVFFIATGTAEDVIKTESWRFQSTAAQMPMTTEGVMYCTGAL